MHNIAILEKEFLQDMSTGRLLNLLRMVTARICYIEHYCSVEYNGQPMELCHKTFVDYKKEIKEILADRDNLDKKPKVNRIRHRSTRF